MRWLLGIGFLAAIALIAAKLLGLIGWSWWIVAAPLWLWAVIVLAAGGLLVALLRHLPR
jgi:hypothetical protein